MEKASAPLWSVAFMCYNESGTLEDAVRRARAALSTLTPRFEVLIVDDGSTDGCREIAARLANGSPDVRVVQHARNQGIGSVLKDGYRQSRGEIVVVLPADLQFAPEDLPRAAAALEGADVVNICRERRFDPWPRKLVSAIERAMTRLLFGLDVGDLHWVKIYRRGVLAKIRIESGTSLVDTELLVKARLGGAVIKSVTLPHHSRRAGQSHAMSWRALVRSLIDLSKLRLSLWRPDRQA